MREQVKRAYAEAIFDTDRDEALAVVHRALADGMSPETILFEVVIPAIEAMIPSVSEHFEVNLAQHFMASQIAADVTDEMLARFATAPQPVGRMVIGTSVGDFHGLGKRIVIGCLKSYFIEAIDLGLNVAPERFVDEALRHDAQVIGISSMMVHTARGERGCRGVRAILRQRQLEGHIRLIVGGAPYRFDPHLYLAAEADTYAADALEAGPIITRLIQEVNA